MLISKAFDAYKYDFIQLKGQSARTEEMHDFVKAHLVKFIGDMSIEDFSITEVRKWFNELGKTRSKNTVRGYIIKLRNVLQYCKRLGYRVMDEQLVVVPKRQESIVTFLTEEEVAKMIECAYNVRAKFVIALLYSSGIRLEELIDLNRGQIYQRKFTIKGKGGKVRLCFIDERTESLLREYMRTRKDNCNALVVSLQNKERMTRTNVELLVKNAARRAGIAKRVTPHTLRHSYATNFLRNGGNIAYLSKMMGHKSVDTTMVYTHLVDNDLEEQYKNFHSI